MKAEKEGSTQFFSATDWLKDDDGGGGGGGLDKNGRGARWGKASQ